VPGLEKLHVVEACGKAIACFGVFDLVLVPASVVLQGQTELHLPLECTLFG